MFYMIYRITNLINNKTYIGKHQTKNLDDGYMGSGKLLRRAIKKYGVENFKKEILHVVDTEAEMNAKEKELVVLGEMSYNLCSGGQGGFGYINQQPSTILWRRLGGQSHKGMKKPRPKLRKWCMHCGNEIIRRWNLRDTDRFCNHSCSATFNNMRRKDNETSN